MRIRTDTAEERILPSSDPESRQLRTGVHEKFAFPTPSKRPPTKNCLNTKVFSSKIMKGLTSGGTMKESPETDPVQVYCRVKPLDPSDGETCVEVKFPNAICVFPPPSMPWNKAKQGTYTFNNVFDENSTQKSVFDQVARPLVQDLLDGKSSLLFAYGVTGSGKTFTMSGNPDDPGIMPRVLDVLFNSIQINKATRYTFKSDHMNGFDCQTKAEIMLQRQQELMKPNARHLRSAANIAGNTPAPSGTDSDDDERSADTTVLPIKDMESVFSVFVTYVQIYNKSIYDLLDEASYVPDFSKKTTGPQAKLTRSDPSGNMYVHNVVEVEVESAEEALQVLKRGQKRRKFAQTLLNTESSRSHSIFNVRLVQAPYDSAEDEVVDDKSLIRVSQLSLVDLAGSERNTRTQTVGDRLREAGRINASIMNLHKCMVALRRRQQRGDREAVVPYRDDKLTNFLKSYFEGQGRIRMLLCLNPLADDYDENLHVCTFAEQAQEIEVVRQPTKPDPPPMTPRGRKENILKTVLMPTPKAGAERLGLSVSLDAITKILPFERFDKPEEGREVFQRLRKALEERMNGKALLNSQLLEKRTEFRNLLVERERWIHAQSVELESMASKLEKADEDKLMRNAVIEKLTQEKDELAGEKEKIERNNKGLLKEIAKLREEYRQLELKHNEERKRLVKDLGLQRELDSVKRDRELKNEEARLKAQYKEKDKAIAAMKELVNRVNTHNVRVSRSSTRRRKYDDESFSVLSASASSDSEVHHSTHHSPTPLPSRSKSTSNIRVTSEPPNTRSRGVMETPIPLSSTALINPRRSRSQVQGGKWIEHTPAPNPTLAGSTLLQPHFDKSKSVTKILKAEDLVSPKVTNYCLRMDIQDSRGAVETQLYKGEVNATPCGGAAIIFNDVEILRQKSPLDPSLQTRKRGSPEAVWVHKDELAQRCSKDEGVGFTVGPKKKKSKTSKD